MAAGEKLQRILDPACGSGAFLVQAFDQLHGAYEASNDRLAELRGHRTLFDLDKRILENNLYGVDINEEAIEICRLSLWIKTAERGKVLTSLDDTICVGNSIIADPTVHPKAFDWQAAFPEVSKAGGFDVVVANPPYTLVERKAPLALEATSGQILESVNVLAARENVEKGDDWPKSPARMSIAIKGRRLVLNELGIAVTKLPRQGTARNWRFAMKPGDAGDASDAPTSSASHESSQPNSIPGNGLGDPGVDDGAFLASLMQKLTEEAPELPLDEDEILQWVPDRWEQFHGNESAIDSLTTIVDDLFVGRPGHNLLLTGGEDTGREALVFHAVRTLVCHEPQGLDPCGKCLNCQWEFGNETTFGKAEKENEFNFMQVDCSRLVSGKLEFEMSKVQAYPGRLIVYSQPRHPKRNPNPW